MHFGTNSSVVQRTKQHLIINEPQRKRMCFHTLPKSLRKSVLFYETLSVRKIVTWREKYSSASPETSLSLLMINGCFENFLGQVTQTIRITGRIKASFREQNTAVLFRKQFRQVLIHKLYLIYNIL